MPNSFLCLLLVDLDAAARADGAAPLTDREPQPLIHRDRVDQLHPHLRVVSRHHHLSPLRQHDRPGDIRRPEIELRPIPTEERVMPAPLLLGQHIHLSIELRVRRDRPRHPHHLTPPIPPPEPTFKTPCSTRPVTTVPRPVIENTSSIGIWNGLSTSRDGSGIYESTASINSLTCAAAAA